VAQSLAVSHYEAALKAVESEAASAAEKAEMLMEIAMGMQLQPKSSEPIEHAIELYRRALAICPDDSPLLRARITTRLGTALQALPDGADGGLAQARECYETALLTLKQAGTATELAELEMNLGLVQQAQAPSGAARLHDAIQCYHRALRTFTREAFPQEFAILHNNLGVAYLSIPLSDERGPMREALAVQSFEEVLKVVNLVDHPSEYAMIQNNLGNALQYAASGHPLDNNLRALDAYDEALKVRNARDTPVEYANTLCNKANVLRNLPEDPDTPGRGRAASLRKAHDLYREARHLFASANAMQNCGIVDEALLDVDLELKAHTRSNSRPQSNGKVPHA
jgi:tetratricopeptide (TPR) repeat protein